MGYLTREASLKHYGVPGMRWGHRKASGISSGKPVSTTPRPKPSGSGRSPEAQARINATLRVGTQVTKAVLLTAGTIGVSMVAGPIVAAGARAAVQALMDHGIMTIETKSSGGPDSFGKAPAKGEWQFERVRKANGELSDLLPKPR